MVASSDREREFSFTHQHFSKVRDELYDYAGIVLADHKQDMAYNRLVRRLRELHLDNFDDYLALLDRNPAEFTQFINALTTNLTAFFRERHHFDFISNTLFYQLCLYKTFMINRKISDFTSHIFYELCSCYHRRVFYFRNNDVVLFTC